MLVRQVTCVDHAPSPPESLRRDRPRDDIDKLSLKQFADKV